MSFALSTALPTHLDGEFNNWGSRSGCCHKDPLWDGKRESRGWGPDGLDSPLPLLEWCAIWFTKVMEAQLTPHDKIGLLDTAFLQLGVGTSNGKQGDRKSFVFISQYLVASATSPNWGGPTITDQQRQEIFIDVLGGPDSMELARKRMHLD